MGRDLVIEEKGMGGIVLYQTPDGHTSLDVKLEDETVWLTQAQMAALFETTKQNVSLHVNNLFKEGELIREMVVKDFFTTWKKQIFLQQFSEILHSAHFGNLDSASGCRFSLYFRMIFPKICEKIYKNNRRTQ